MNTDATVWLPFNAALEANWTYQLGLVAISLIGLLSYYAGYRIAAVKPPSGSHSLPGYLYIGGVVASLTWYVMPFLEQPRISGWLDWLRGSPVSTPGLAMTTFGLVLGVIFFAFGSKSTMRNLTVTAENFFAPARLLTDGLYGIIRHPMLMTDVLAHLGVAMAIGATQTLLLIPIYYLINEAFVSIQETYILKPKFADEYRAYSARTPRMFNRWIAVITITAAILIAWAFARANVT